jgi:hypothetical protein
VNALFAGLVVAIAGAVVDFAVIPFDRYVMVHQLIGDFISGLVASLVFLALQLHNEEQHYVFSAERAATMTELNHHIRNAVFPLCLAVQRTNDIEANRIANEAVERINAALRDAASDAVSGRVSYSRALTEDELKRVA